MKSHYFDYIEICPPFRHPLIILYGLMFWLTQFVQEHASTHNSPASRQEHFLTSTHYFVCRVLMSQVLNHNRSRCPSVHCRSDESIIASWPAMTNWFNQLLGLGCGSCTKWLYDILHEGYAGWKCLRLGEALLPTCLLSWQWCSALIECINVSLLLSKRILRGFQRTV